MSDDKVTITEKITFFEGGGSRHVWTLPDGSVWREATFVDSPVLFHKKGDTWGLETAAERGIVGIERKVKVHPDELR
jgi:hypothetical protein